MVAADWLLLVAVILLALGEALAFTDRTPENTLSERIRTWVTGGRWAALRRVVLAVLLGLLYTHLVYEWPW